MFAITPNGVGKPVGARSISSDWPLAVGESLKVEQWAPDMVLAEDGASLRKGTPEELAPPQASDEIAKIKERLSALEDAARVPVR